MFLENVLNVKNEWWRYFLGCIIIFIGTQLGSIPFVIAIFSKIGAEGASKIDQTSMMYVLEDSNLTLFYFLLPYLFGFIGIILVIKFLHNQTFLSITTSRKTIDFSKMRTSFTIASFFVIVTTVFSYIIYPDEYTYNFELTPFLILFSVVVLLIPIQTSWEEYVFRGYLMQGIGGMVNNKWVPLIITSISFGLLHYWNPEVMKLGPVLLIHYVLTGLFFGIITLMDKGMELAIGFHAGNNMLIALLVTADWTVLQTNSVLKSIGQPEIISMLIPIFILYPLTILYFSKKYNWKNWKENLTGKIK